MPASNPSPPRSRPVDAATLKAFSHPLRMRLYDHLKDHGPATASHLARALDESSGQTSYHLRQLERHGLVADDPGRGTSRERWWRAEGFSFGLEVAEDDEARTAVEVVLRHQVAARAAHQLAAIERQHAEPPAWHDASISSEATVRMTAEEAAALHAEVGRVIDAHVGAARARRAESGDEGTRMLKTYYVGFPLPEEERPEEERPEEERAEEESPAG